MAERPGTDREDNRFESVLHHNPGLPGKVL